MILPLLSEQDLIIFTEISELSEMDSRVRVIAGNYREKQGVGGCPPFGHREFLE